MMEDVRIVLFFWMASRNMFWYIRSIPIDAPCLMPAIVGWIER